MAVGRIETLLVFSAVAVTAGVVGMAFRAPLPSWSTPALDRPDKLQPTASVAIPVLAFVAPEIQPIPTQKPYVATADNEFDWRPDRVPAEWPRFTKLPDEKPLTAKSARQKIDFAKALNDRWFAYSEKKSKTFPSPSDTSLAVKYLLSIATTAPEYPEAWATFIRARQVDRLVWTEAEMVKMNKPSAPKRSGVSIGMTKSEVIASSWGKPRSINETLTANGRHEQWVYGGGYLYLDNGVLTSIQTSRR